MIFVILDEDVSDYVKSPIEINDQLDSALDSGTITYLKTETHTSGIRAPLSKCVVAQPQTKFDSDYVGFDSRALVRQNVKKAAITANGVITNEKVPPISYKHTASGEISISDENVAILSVEGSIFRTHPSAKYANGKITWYVQWTNTVEYPPNTKYVVTIKYASSKNGVYSHQLELTEPSKLLQGVLIDGLGVSQPEDYNSRKTLLDVVTRLLAVTPFDDGTRFAITSDELVKGILQAVKAPEFKWNTQTTLWECLLQVGAVVDAMPRLVADASGEYTVVTFEFVNAVEKFAETIDDGQSNAFGENVNESQYNTALSAIVENLRENE